METAPHFFKIILDSTIRQGKLSGNKILGMECFIRFIFFVTLSGSLANNKIKPSSVHGYSKKVCEKIWKCLSSPVILSVPSGAIWRVELLNAMAMFGWDKSASEIEYPCNNIYNANPDHDELQDNKIEENEDDTSVEALDDQSQCKKMGEKSTFLCAQSRKGPAVLSAGWRVFSRENALEVGDVCVFELIKRNVLNMVAVKFVKQHGNCLSRPATLVSQVVLHGKLSCWTMREILVRKGLERICRASLS
ncbi:hypothetical protein GH714_035697 [Hevea brasiliensis]|uniref:TF-B3 domain-containing protein n=1 Tax=Hevea brasiliensis TaxID=3981 RepID=A0A6A6L6V8_HEVBR|nr:hypothetical protein GH714_035697 [Hevea brasiliensis]